MAKKLTQKMMDADPEKYTGMEVGDQIEEAEETVQVPLKTLTAIQEQLAENEKKMADMEAKNAGLEELFQKQNSNSETGEAKLRQRKNFEPKFRTVRIRKFPIAGDPDNLGFVIGWTNRGAYQMVDRTGVAPQTVDFIDIVFLGHEKNAEGKINAERVKLLDLMNAPQINCKILESKKEQRLEPTGEEIDVTIFDPNHGLVSTGEKVDGYVAFSDIEYKIQIPGVTEPVWIDDEFCNG